ncbi:MAG: membrane protein insertion efficiency factor YidD [Buchnera aphidicola (Schlechtendalia peitan)]
MITKFIILIVLFYQRFISILFVPHCRFYPTCSYYALSVLRHFGLIKGCFLIINRILKCHPFHSGGYDNISKTVRKKREH